ncbi:hypothetical protein SAMN05421752_10435 [Natronorubrum thiooxidans]|uniref:Uncharacterized protein n=1 Tax=Natronorubrum thiooxidans TaxID=308853 RepID=A0A1N7EEU7_9EURY|nr:hypothetical protein SAMN05421752_10435 [Natronorubrum thiooxidans]
MSNLNPSNCSAGVLETGRKLDLESDENATERHPQISLETPYAVRERVRITSKTENTIEKKSVTFRYVAIRFIYSQ